MSVSARVCSTCHPSHRHPYAAPQIAASGHLSVSTAISACVSVYPSVVADFVRLAFLLFLSRLDESAALVLCFTCGPSWLSLLCISSHVSVTVSEGTSLHIPASVSAHVKCTLAPRERVLSLLDAACVQRVQLTGRLPPPPRPICDLCLKI